MVRFTGLHWYDEITRDNITGGRVLLGGYPWPQSVVRNLEMKERVNFVVNTVGERRDRIFSSPVEVVNIPMTDFAEPTALQLKQAVAEIDLAYSQGKTVYVHCKAGKGRSATAVLCWLVMRLGLSPTEAQALLTEKRPQVLGSISNRKVVKELLAK